MKKLIILSLFVFFFSIQGGLFPAYATDTFRFPIFNYSERTFQAGEFCDFPYHLTELIDGFAVVFLDGDGNFEKVYLVEQSVKLTHTNLSTGETLSEDGSFVGHLTFEEGVQTETAATGVLWHFRDAEGKLVVTHAGRIHINFVTGEVSYTPNSGANPAEVICPALGGAPAF